jgi:hypothetical protein
MSVNFDLEQYDHVSVPELICVCRVQAREARKLAGLNADQPAYVKIAEQWDTLAAQIEQAERVAAAE